MMAFTAVFASLALSGQNMDCGENVTVCGVLTLETGLGTGVYQNKYPGVHGLWPETAPYGNSVCVAPSGSYTPPSKVYPCYIHANGGNNASIITFEQHEWSGSHGGGGHGLCAGVEDADDYFEQICLLSAPPLKLIVDAWAAAGDKTFAIAQNAMAKANIEVFSTDSHDQLSLSACLNSDSGDWSLAAIADFPRVCGSKNPPPRPPPSPSPSPPSPSGDHCVPDKHGPPCHDDADCRKYSGCVRCAHSGFCTSTPDNTAESD